MSSPNNQVITLNSGSTFTAPNSWRATKFANHVQVVSPEKDLTLYYFEQPLIAQSITTIVEQAWRQIMPDFNLSIAEELSMPVTDAWEKKIYIKYDTPSSESRLVMAMVRTFNNQIFINLIDGTMASFSRRGAEVNVMVDSLSPVGFRKTDLSQHEPKVWTELDIQAFDNFVQSTMRELNVPGVSIGIVRQDGQMLYKKAFGIKQLGSDKPVTPDTLFMIGSNTKPLTTLLMATLIDQHKITWETPITTILPSFKLKNPKSDPEFSKNLRLRDTVSAATGMPRWDVEWLFKYKGTRPEHRLVQMQTMEPTTKIGEVFQYSNLLVAAGGYAAARVYNTKTDLEHAYNEAMHELVFKPLKMDRTVIKIKDAMQLGAAMPHGISYDGTLYEVPLDLEESIYSVAPAGAGWSTVEDLSKYLVLEMNNGVLDGKQIISASTILERRKPGIKIGADYSYGLGLCVSNEQGLKFISHGGGTMGFASSMFFIPEKGIGMVVLTNASGIAHMFLESVKQRFLELTFDAKPQSEAIIASALKMQRDHIADQIKRVATAPKDLLWIKDLLGKYESSTLGSCEILQIANNYEIRFADWQTRIGSEIEANGQKLLVLLDGPFPGGFKLVVADNHNKLTLNNGQEKHEFIRLAPVQLTMQAKL